MPPSADAALLARAHANYAEGFRVLARTLPGGAIDEADGLALVATGLPAALFNPAFAGRVPADPAAALARVQAFYRRAGVVSWQLIAVGEVAEALAPAAAAAGLVAGPRVPGMLLAPLACPPRPDPPGLRVQVVADAETLRRYVDTAAAGFGVPRERIARLDNPALLRVPDLTFYLGEVDGAPVATAGRFASHRIAGVIMVGTVPARRRRGLGEAMTWRAALDGAGEGCLASYLQATPMGFPLYARMGYEHVADYQTWAPPATA